MLTQTTGDMKMSSMTQISKSGICKYNGGGLIWTSKENASKDPLKGHWRKFVCNWCDFYWLVVNVYALGNGDYKYRAKETKIKLLNVAFHT